MRQRRCDPCPYPGSVTLKTRLIPLAALVGLTLTVAGCTGGPNLADPSDTPSASAPASTIAEGACEGDSGVTLQVDSSALEGGSVREWCRTTDEQIPVTDLLEDAGVTTQGTEEYGDDFVCRVDGLPSADEPVGSTEDPDYVEGCEKTAAAFAYWSLWVRSDAGAEWAYAQEGITTLLASPGESISLLFVLDGAPAAPTS